MKLIIREYLASLRERGELDAILPDLLSELGFHVFSRPRRGTLQHGVDIAAVSPGEDDGRRLYLFSIKQGDLTRQDWDGNPQALRSSLDEILDAYIPNHVPVEYSTLPIAICICFGGDMQEQVRESVTGFTKKNTTARVTFEEWNGDKLAGLILEGVLREEILPKPMRAYFQKAVALLDEPDIAYQHFALLCGKLRVVEDTSQKERTRSARQLYICVWVMFVWGRDIDNVEAPYRVSELAILTVWELLKPSIGSKSREINDLSRVLTQLITLHIGIAAELIDKKIVPHVMTRDAVAAAVRSRSSIDVNLKLFDLLGRIGMVGAWLHQISQRQEAAERREIQDAVTKYCEVGLSMIENNSVLWLPVTDSQATSIALFLMLCLGSNIDGGRVASWLEAMVYRYEFTVARRGRYPTSHAEYRFLVDHPRDRTDEYFKEATSGSTLLPLLAAWVTAFGRQDLATRLGKMVAEEFDHCTMQLWTPDQSSEVHLFVNSDSHGRAICDLSLNENGAGLLEMIQKACEKDEDFGQLSAIRTGYWPVVLLSCRHWGLPIPPNFWIGSLLGLSNANPENPNADDVGVM